MAITPITAPNIEDGVSDGEDAATLINDTKRASNELISTIGSRSFNVIDQGSSGILEYTLSSSDFNDNLPPYFAIYSLGDSDTFTLTVPSSVDVSEMLNVSEIYLRKGINTLGTVTITGEAGVNIWGQVFGTSASYTEEATIVLRRIPISLGAETWMASLEYNYTTP